MNRSLWNGFGFDPAFREYYSRWDAKAVRHLDAIASLAGCLEPRFYRAPNLGNDQLLPSAYNSYVLSLLPGSYICGFMHRPSPYVGNAAFEVLNATQDGFRFLSVATSTTGNLVSVNIPVPGASSSLAVTVVANAVSITLASDSNANITSTLLQVQAAIVASGAASALLTCVIIGNGNAVSPTTATTNLAGGGLAVGGTLLSAINYAVQITDMILDHRFFSNPIRDDFLSGIPAILENPHPVVTPGDFLCEFWNTSPTQPITANLIFIVAEPVTHDLLNDPNPVR
jgi:hypothetical protein